MSRLADYFVVVGYDFEKENKGYDFDKESKSGWNESSGFIPVAGRLLYEYGASLLYCHQRVSQ